MSLIFEALKKLDREKQAPERGFLVVGASGWGAGRRARVVPIAAALGAAGLAGFLFAQWAQRPKVEPANGPSAAPATVAPASVTPPTAPPATYLAPSMPAAVRPAAPPATALAAPPNSAPRAEPRSAAPPPTQPAAIEAPGPVQPTFTLQAVTEQDGHPVAIVNGQLVRVGDTVEGAEVIRIDPQAVELAKDGRRIVVSF